MNLYLLTQNINTGYDTYDSCIVAAECKHDARRIDPNRDEDYWKKYPDRMEMWVPYTQIEEIQVKKIGTTDLPVGLVLASFHAA